MEAGKLYVISASANRLSFCDLSCIDPYRGCHGQIGFRQPNYRNEFSAWTAFRFIADLQQGFYRQQPDEPNAQLIKSHRICPDGLLTGGRRFDLAWCHDHHGRRLRTDDWYFPADLSSPWSTSGRNRSNRRSIDVLSVVPCWLYQSLSISTVIVSIFFTTEQSVYDFIHLYYHTFP